MPNSHPVCVLVDDLPGELRDFERVIKSAWALLGAESSIQVLSESDFGAATEKLGTAYRGLDIVLVVVDVMQGASQQPGWEVVEAARRECPTAGVIAMSVVDFTDKAAASGAHEFLFKEKQRTHSSPHTHFAGVIRRVMAKVGRESMFARHVSIVPAKDGIRLEALMEEVGKTALEGLAAELVPGLQVATARFVRPGMSGAFLLALDVTQSTGAGGTGMKLLKGTRSRAQLERELRGRDRSEAFGPDVFLSFGTGGRDTKIAESEGWFGIVSPFRAGAETLLEWLLREDAEGQPDSLLEQLFEGLQVRFREARDAATGSARSPSEHLFMTLAHPRRARIQMALEELRPLLEEMSCAGAGDLGRIETLLEAGRFGDVDQERVRSTSIERLSHGDLHARNAIVVGGRLVRLVDPANVAEYHWATDIARLVSDVIVSGWDGGTKSYRWDRFGVWVDVVNAALSGDPAPAFNRADASPTNGRVAALLRWVEENRPRVFTGWLPNRDWEYRLALAIEFLRASYRTNELPPPKRALGLIAGALGLGVAEKGFAAAAKGTPSP